MSALYSKSLITLAITSAISLPVLASDNQDSNPEMEEVSVVAKKLSHANHVIDPAMAQQQSSVNMPRICQSSITMFSKKGRSSLTR